MHFIQIALLVVLLGVCSCGDDTIVNYDCSPDGKTLDLCITSDEGAKLYAKEQPKPKVVNFLDIYGIEDQSVLNHFNEVESIERLTVASSPGIKNFKWLKSLKKVKMATIEFNSGLVNFEGLENLEEIDPAPWKEATYIQHNKNLENLKGLSGLVRAAYGLHFDNNAKLTTIEHLTSLEETSGFTIRLTPKMKVISALPKLKRINGILAEKNENLERIEPFPMLERVEIGVGFFDNPKFSDCSAEQFVALDPNFNGKLDLIGNKPSSKCADLE